MSRARAAIISGLRSVPGLTVGEIAECDIDLSSISVAELYGGVAFKSNTVTKELVVEIRTGVETRTKADRIAFDENIRLVLSGSELHLNSEAIASAHDHECGGKPTPDQLRKSLARSIAEGLVKRTGKARGTRYTLTAKGRKMAS